MHLAINPPTISLPPILPTVPIHLSIHQQFYQDITSTQLPTHPSIHQCINSPTHPPIHPLDLPQNSTVKLLLFFQHIFTNFGLLILNMKTENTSMKLIVHGQWVGFGILDGLRIKEIDIKAISTKLHAYVAMFSNKLS